MAASEISIANLTNFEKIQNVFNDEKAYKEILENSETFNTRLCIERRLRMPFLDPQTGVAQNHSSLFFSSKQRLPGFREGQIYTYPSKRWQKPKRQYLLHRESYKAYQYREKTYLQHHFNSAETVSGKVNTASNDSTSMGASADNDSKDSHGAPEKEWFYEDMESHVDDFEEDFESDMDFDESYSKKKRRGRVPKKAPADRGETTPKRGRGGGRGRRKMAVQAIENDRRRSTTNSSSAPATATPSSSTNVGSPLNTTEEHPPMSSTPPGVMDPPSTHHLPPPPLPPPHVQPPTHFQHYQFPLHHSQPPQIPPSFPMPNPFNSSSSTPSGSNVPPEDQASSPPSTTSAATASTSAGSSTSTTTSASTSSPTKSTMSTLNHAKIRTNEQRDKADPSPYCDFCLGDAKENRKTNVPEELVSCADCGRSGHPTCLQFTPNMIISVKRYRWQCIECKYCSICGTSDNDDQLLFCDDCDRGYHMYCLSPPLTTPPEGSWSCKLCLEEFHTPKK